MPLRVRGGGGDEVGAGPFIAEHLPFKEAKERWIDHFEIHYLKDLLERPVTVAQQTVITSYSIHYTKLYEKPARMWRDARNCA